MDDETRREIGLIKERNMRVEADKAWETSLSRKAIISMFTYALAVLVLAAIRAPEPLVNALIPTLGFVLSATTFDFIKKWWMENIYRK